MVARNRSFHLIVLALASGAWACDGSTTAPEIQPATIEATTILNQVVIAGNKVEILPSVVVKDSAGSPMPGLRVVFATASGGTLEGDTAITDNSGIATLGGWTTSPVPGGQFIEARVENLDHVAIFVADAIKPGWIVQSIHTGSFFTCAIAPSRAAYCWGGGGSGSLGASASFSPSPLPVLGGINFQAIDTKFLRVCGLDTDGKAFCWGYERKISDCCVETVNRPTLVEATLSFSSITTGGYHTCTLTNTGDAYCWGQNSSGQLGNGDTGDRTEPVAVSGSHRFIDLSAGFTHTCGVLDTGDAYCWGDNASGQLGTGTVATSNAPVAVQGNIKFRNISAGLDYTCGVSISGTAYCWGKNDGPGNLGDGTAAMRLVPTPVTGAIAFTSISAGSGTTCGIGSDGFAYCWGSNTAGKLGNGTGINSISPSRAAPGLKFQAIVTSGSHTCAISTSGSSYCWGSNTAGALGNGTNFPASDQGPEAVTPP